MRRKLIKGAPKIITIVTDHHPPVFSGITLAMTNTTTKEKRKMKNHHEALRPLYGLLMSNLPRHGKGSKPGSISMIMLGRWTNLLNYISYHDSIASL